MVTRYDDTTVELSWSAPFDWGIPIEGYVLEMRSCDVFYETQSASDCDGYYGPGEYVPVKPSAPQRQQRMLSPTEQQKLSRYLLLPLWQCPLPLLPSQSHHPDQG